MMEKILLINKIFNMQICQIKLCKNRYQVCLNNKNNNKIYFNQINNKIKNKQMAE